MVQRLGLGFRSWGWRGKHRYKGNTSHKKVIIWKPNGPEECRMSPKSSKLSSLDWQSDGMGRKALESRETGRVWENVALGPNPNPQSPLLRKSLQDFLSFVHFPELCRHAQQDSFRSSWMFWTYANAQVTRRDARTHGLFHSFGCCGVIADKPVLFAFLLCHVHQGRCRGAQLWPGGWALAPVHGTTHCRFPCQHSLNHFWELVHCLQLREFSFCYFLHYCFFSIWPAHSF